MSFASLFVVFGGCSSFRVAGSLADGYSQLVCLGRLQLVLCFLVGWGAFYTSQEDGKEIVGMYKRGLRLPFNPTQKSW